MQITEGLGEIIGRRIAGVFLRVRDDQPRGHLLLAFDDGTSFEFVSESTIDVVRCLQLNDLESAAAYRRNGQLFCYEARLSLDGSEVIERQYAGEMDVKCDAMRRLVPPAVARPAQPAPRPKSRWRRFMELLFNDLDEWE